MPELTAFSAFKPLITSTFAFRPTMGKPLLPLGAYANVLKLTEDIGIAITTDGVGTKLLIAQQTGKFDTIGADLVAMNVNDLLCVGSEPIAMTVYLAIAAPTNQLLKELGQGLLDGAQRANISIADGELTIDEGFDIAGTAIGVVHPDHIIDGRNARPGDVVLGLRSSGIHCNGLSLARYAFRHSPLGVSPADLGRTVGEELLEPTMLYTNVARAMLDQHLPISAFCHITGDGLTNLNRVAAPVGFILDNLPLPQPIFSMIQNLAKLSDAEMYTTFNMGIGFCVVLPPDSVDHAQQIATQHGHESWVIGRTTNDPTHTVKIPALNLKSEGNQFKASTVT